MKKIRALLFAGFLMAAAFHGTAFAAKIRGEFAGLTPSTKSILVTDPKRPNGEQEIRILVPDGSYFAGPAKSIAYLKKGDEIEVTVKSGEKEGSWIATEINQIKKIGKS